MPLFSVKTSMMCHGVNKVSTDLGVVSVRKNKNEVDSVAIPSPTVETNINAAYEDIIVPVLSTKLAKVKQKVDPVTKQEDYYKMFGTARSAYRMIRGYSKQLMWLCSLDAVGGKIE